MAGEIWILLAAVALIGWGIYPVLLKKVVRELGEYTCLVFNYLVLVVFLALTAVFTIRLTMPTDYVTAAVIVGAIVGAVAIYLYYKAINTGNVSIVVVIAATNVIWTVLLSYFLFNEKLSVSKYIAIAAIFAGAVLIAMEKIALPKKFDEKHIFNFLKSDIWSKGAALALLVSFCWAFYNLIMKYNVKSIGPHKAMIYMETLLFLFLLLAFLTKPAKELVTIPKKEHLKWLLPSALLFTAGALGMYFAMKYSPLSVVAPVVSAAPVVSVIGAAAILKERVRIHQYTGIVMAVAGIFVLSI
ncbi:DMT family transporter [Candidatus Woesearchaeota archaeon]|nr:DMT family transporter [Candidatus Woesearchaeota archaeon]